MLRPCWVSLPICKRGKYCVYSLPSRKPRGTRSKEVMAYESFGVLGRGFVCVSYVSHEFRSLSSFIHALCTY